MLRSRQQAPGEALLCLQWAWAVWEAAALAGRARARCEVLRGTAGELQRAAWEAGQEASDRWDMGRELLQAEVDALRTELEEKSARWEVQRAGLHVQIERLLARPPAALPQLCTGLLDPSLVGAYSMLNQVFRRAHLAHCFMAWATCAQQTQEAAALVGGSLFATGRGSLKGWSPENCVAILLRDRARASPHGAARRSAREVADLRSQLDSALWQAAEAKRTSESLAADLASTRADLAKATEALVAALSEAERCRLGATRLLAEAGCLRGHLEAAELRAEGCEAARDALGAARAAAAKAEGEAAVLRGHLAAAKEDSAKATARVESLRADLSSTAAAAARAESAALALRRELDSVRQVKETNETLREQLLAAERASSDAAMRAEKLQSELDTVRTGAEKGTPSTAAPPAIRGSPRAGAGAGAGAAALAPPHGVLHKRVSFIVAPEAAGPADPGEKEEALTAAELTALKAELMEKMEGSRVALQSALQEVSRHWDATRIRFAAARHRAVDAGAAAAARRRLTNTFGRWSLLLRRRLIWRREHARWCRKRSLHAAFCGWARAAAWLKPVDAVLSLAMAKAAASNGAAIALEPRELVCLAWLCWSRGYLMQLALRRCRQASAGPAGSPNGAVAGRCPTSESELRSTVLLLWLLVSSASKAARLAGPAARGESESWNCWGADAGEDGGVPPLGQTPRWGSDPALLSAMLEEDPSLLLPAPAAPTPHWAGDTLGPLPQSTWGADTLGLDEVEDAILPPPIPTPQWGHDPPDPEGPEEDASSEATASAAASSSHGNSRRVSMASASGASPARLSVAQQQPPPGSSPGSNRSSRVSLSPAGADDGASGAGGGYSARLSRRISTLQLRAPRAETPEEKMERLLREGVQTARPDNTPEIEKLGPSKYRIGEKTWMVKLVGGEQVLIKKGAEWVPIPQFFIDPPPAFAPGGGAGRLGFPGQRPAAKSTGSVPPLVLPKPAGPGPPAAKAAAGPKASPRASTGSLTPPPKAASSYSRGSAGDISAAAAKAKAGASPPRRASVRGPPGSGQNLTPRGG